jgi:hypothetical protein
LEGTFVEGRCEWHRLCYHGNLMCDSSVTTKDHWSHRECLLWTAFGAAYEYVGWFPTTSEDCESWGTPGNETLVLSVLLAPASVKLDTCASWFLDCEFYPCEKLSQQGISEPFVARVL